MSGLPILESVLSGAAGVTSIVSDRIYYLTAPQGIARPYLVLIQTNETDEVLLAGASQFPESLCNVICIADSFPVLESLGAAVIGALQDAKGVFRGKSATVSRDPVDSMEFLPADRVYRRILGFSIWYR